MRVKALQSFFTQGKNYDIGVEYEITDQKFFNELVKNNYVIEIKTNSPL